MATTLRQFTDAKGVSHTIRFDYRSVLRMAAVGFDVRDIRKAEEALAEIEADRFKFIEVLVACLQPADVDAFRDDVIDGEVSNRAYDAFVEAVLDFFPRLRPVLTALKERIQKLAEKATAEIREGKMDGLLQAMWTEQFGNTPASSEPTPATSA